jgi:anti-sigma B factor antagonist
LAACLAIASQCGDIPKTVSRCNTGKPIQGATQQGTDMELKGKIEDNDVLVIALNEDNLDASNAREFKDAVQSMMHERTRVVLDMSGVKFVDSSGLGALISCLRQLNGRKGDFKLCAMSKTVRALFELMRMHRVFNIHDSREEAVRSFA